MLIRPALIPDGTEGAGDGARLKVRDPFSREFLADTGEEKPGDGYWLRRIADGSVELMPSDERLAEEVAS